MPPEISDGKKVCILDGLSFDGVSEVDTSAGFAALICFVNGTVSPVASAICGAFQSAAMGIREEIEKLERVKNDGYNDEALAQENYYEYEQTDKDRGAVRENTEKEKDGESVRKNEKDNVVREKEPTAGGLAGGDFFGRMKDEIEKVLSSYPSERALEETVEDSRWVRINYGGDKFYVFGVIYGGGKPRYICYGVPSTDSRRPPESLSNLASYIPSSPENAEGGYWVMYQDAATGASVKIHGA